MYHPEKDRVAPLCPCGVVLELPDERELRRAWVEVKDAVVVEHEKPVEHDLRLRDILRHDVRVVPEELHPHAAL